MGPLARGTVILGRARRLKGGEQIGRDDFFFVLSASSSERSSAGHVSYLEIAETRPVHRHARLRR